MRLLLRANAHRRIDAGLEVAASPDTPTRPEPWSWHLRLLDRLHDASPDDAVVLVLGDESPWAGVAVEADPGVVKPDLSLQRLEGTVRVEREEDELIVLVVASGSALIEGRHGLAAGDAMVFTGDDPLRVDATGTDADLVLARLSSTRQAAVAWVP